MNEASLNEVRVSWLPVPNIATIRQLATPTRLLDDPSVVCISWCRPVWWWWNLQSWFLALWPLGKDILEVSDSSRTLSNTAGTRQPPLASSALEVWEKQLLLVEVEEGPRVWLWGVEEWFWIWFWVCFSHHHHHRFCWVYWSLHWKRATSDNSTLSDTCR